MSSSRAQTNLVRPGPSPLPTPPDTYLLGHVDELEERFPLVNRPYLQRWCRKQIVEPTEADEFSAALVLWGMKGLAGAWFDRELSAVADPAGPSAPASAAAASARARPLAATRASARSTRVQRTRVHTSPAPEPEPAIAPRAAARSSGLKRKLGATSPSPAASTSASASPAPEPASKKKRTGYDMLNPPNNQPEGFGLIVKACLSQLAVTDNAALQAAAALFPASATGSADAGLDASFLAAHNEGRAAKALAADKYFAGKQRLFLGVLLLVEQNRRLLVAQEQYAHRVGVLGRENAGVRPPGLLEFGPAAAQRFGLIDANVLSAMAKAYEEWGWIPQVVVREGNKKVLNPRCHEVFPSSVAGPLLDVVGRFERENVPEGKCRWVQMEGD